MRSRLADHAILQEVTIGKMRIRSESRRVREMEDLHAVGVLDSRQPMRNGDRRTALRSLV